MLRYKLAHVETKAIGDLKDGRIHAVVSTESKDRDGDIIRQAGWNLDDFQAHPVLISSHKYDCLMNQIGTWEDMAVKGRTLQGVARYIIGEGNPVADWGYKLASRGQAAFSVGFIPDMSKAKELPGGDSMWPNYEFNGQTLLETSHVTVPANQEALQVLQAKSKELHLHPVIDELVNELLKDTPPPQVEMEALLQRIAETLEALPDMVRATVQDEIAKALIVDNQDDPEPERPKLVEGLYQFLIEEVAHGH